MELVEVVLPAEAPGLVLTACHSVGSGSLPAVPSVHADTGAAVVEVAALGESAGPLVPGSAGAHPLTSQESNTTDARVAKECFRALDRRSGAAKG